MNFGLKLLRFVGEQLLDARALLHALEVRRGYCISANFIESCAQFTLYFGK
jgi:hypothetical protein